jgi:hypothetical protein
MIRATNTVLVFSIGLLGCYRDPMISRSAPGGQTPAGGDAPLVDGPRLDLVPQNAGRDGSAAMDAGGLLTGDAAVPSPGPDAGALPPAQPDAPVSRLTDAGLPPGQPDAPISRPTDAGLPPRQPDAPVSRPTDAGVPPGFVDAPILQPTDAGVPPGFADAPVTRRPPDAAGPPIPPVDGGPLPLSDAAASRTDTSLPGSDAPSLPGTVLPGGACTDSGQCASLPGLTAVCVPPSIGFASGYCAVPGCSILAQNCPGGSAAMCIPGDNGPICIGTCSAGDSASCRSGYVCQPLGLFLPAVCIPGCVDSTGCPAGTSCFPVAGSPVGQCRDSGSKVGDSCAVASDCPQNGLCVSEIDFGWPHGYCVTSNCTTSANCAAGTACTGNDPNGVCALRCTGDADCRTGYHCVAAGRAGENVCVPHCTSDSQCDDLTCHIGTGLC